MLRLTKLTDYATVVLTHLAAQPNQFHAARDIATKTRIALPTVSKILKTLTRGHLLDSERGVQGGYRLARLATKITLAHIISVMEQNISVTECSHHHSHCSLEPHCSIGKNWQVINRAIHNALDSITLQDLTKPIAPFQFKLNKAIPVVIENKTIEGGING